MSTYVRPIPMIGPASADAALRLAGGWCRFSHVEILARGADPRIVPVDEAPAESLARLTSPRASFAGLSLDRPQLMGIVNVTPDSFSDGGRLADEAAAIAHARALAADGADILDIGGESTRPGAEEIPAEVETARVEATIAALASDGTGPISIDTRKAGVARAALDAGAQIINDVSGFRFDPAMAGLAADRGAPVVLMHSQGDPQTMQDDPHYENPLLDVYDALEAAVAGAEAAGIPRDRILVDPGIGFGKRDPHNLAILGRLSLFHALGCGVLLGVSRKGFIGRIAGIPDAADRDAASAAVGLWALTQGVQVLRVHDIVHHRQGIALWDKMGATGFEEAGT
ncbi:dihydropteroate synthase [Rhodobacterales bacterium HKCCE3408]|nr:dihydropteroate synthase [Rhodobacterales bacterium HKCCE3408]